MLVVGILCHYDLHVVFLLVCIRISIIGAISRVWELFANARDVLLHLHLDLLCSLPSDAIFNQEDNFDCLSTALIFSSHAALDYLV